MNNEHVLECRWESQRCICEELRACEQRVRADERQHMAAKYLVSDREQWEAEQRAYAAGLDAAREAVAAIHMPDPYAWTHDDEGNAIEMVGCDRCFDGEYNYDAYPCPTLLAIDALRDDPPSLPPTMGRAHKY